MMSVIETNIDQIIQQLKQDIENIQEIREQLVPTFAERATELMQEEAPRGPSSFLANSIVKIGDSQEMRVTPMAEYAQYVVSGTSPSPGRYVPAIGKRLVTEKKNIGVHPGIQPNPFVDRALDRLLTESEALLEQVVRIFH